MAQEEIKELRYKLEKQQQQFENYREECKVLENFLQEESQKKEQEIRKLKEDAIVKEKNYKLLKTQNSQLKSEINNLKDQLASKVKSDQSSQIIQQDQSNKLKAEIEQLKAQLSTNSENQESSSEQLKDLDQKLAQKVKQNLQLQSQLKQSIKQLEDRNFSIEELSKEVKEKQEKINEHSEKINSLKNELDEQKEQLDKLVQKNGEIKSKLKSQRTQQHKKTIKKQERPGRDKMMEKDLERAEEKIKRYEAKLQKMELIIKELKHKLSESKKTLSPQKLTKEDNELNSISKIYTGCLVITKPYYISPFLEINCQAKVIKVYKSSRHGCFEKSLGATKHRLDSITHEQDQIISEVVDRIKNFQEDYPHFVLIFGSKKTSKKALLTQIVSRMFEFLKQKLHSCQTSDVSAVYIRKAADEEQCDQRKEALSTQQILELLHSIINTNTAQPSSPKKGEKVNGISLKKIEKPRLTYLNVRINDFCLEIATSSFTNIPIRQKESLSTFYNNVLYSKLPDILQSSYGQKYNILSLNPIVDLYEDCKNVLNATQYRLFQSPTGKYDDDSKQTDINKEMLNAMARRKLQQLERELESNNIKIRKIEDERFFYKVKFEELQQRLKNLISTHHNQNSYLKKSPILLSYEKMLKFIHSVQTKYSSGQENGNNVISINDLDFESDISMEAM